MGIGTAPAAERAGEAQPGWRPAAPPGLERLTKPLDSPPGQVGCGQGEEGLVDGLLPVVSDLESAVSVQPGERAFDDPPVLAQARLRLDSLPRYPSLDVPSSTGALRGSRLVGTVSMELVGTLATLPRGRANRWYRVQHGHKHLDVVHVGGGHADGQGRPVPVDDQVVLGPWSSSVGGVGTCRFAPLFAGT